MTQIGNGFATFASEKRFDRIAPLEKHETDSYIVATRDSSRASISERSDLQGSGSGANPSLESFWMVLRIMAAPTTPHPCGNVGVLY